MTGRMLGGAIATISGDKLLLFNFDAGALFTYRRTCAR
jgi:hypothetical protein